MKDSKKKRRKLSNSSSSDKSEEDSEDEIESFKVLVTEIEDLGRRHASLFEWSDGPLVHAMKSGQMLLLDEMSLAEDAVLERLNSVLEPSRTLVLAEKGDDGSEVESRIIQANDGFRIFATMNPGGDFGKELLKSGEEASIDFGMSELKKIFGNKVDKDLIKSHAVDWSSNPLFLGAWASAEPGAFKYREILRSSVGDRIYFAGEATSRRYRATVHGAWLTGVREARRIVRSLQLSA